MNKLLLSKPFKMIDLKTKEKLISFEGEYIYWDFVRDKVHTDDTIMTIDITDEDGCTEESVSVSYSQMKALYKELETIFNHVEGER